MKFIKLLRRNRYRFNIDNNKKHGEYIVIYIYIIPILIQPVFLKTSTGVYIYRNYVIPETTNIKIVLNNLLRKIVLAFIRGGKRYVKLTFKRIYNLRIYECGGESIYLNKYNNRTFNSTRRYNIKKTR